MWSPSLAALQDLQDAWHSDGLSVHVKEIFINRHAGDKFTESKKIRKTQDQVTLCHLTGRMALD